MTYDPKCYDLAVEFLEEINPPDRVYDRLAQHIQDTIENFLGDEDNFPQPEPMFDTRRERDEWRHEAAQQQKLK